MSRPTTATLSTQNLLHNIAAIKAFAKPAKIIAMVKANAYGHGIGEVGLRLDGQVDMLGVACIEEALLLRHAGVKTPILLAQGICEAHELVTACTNNFHVAFNNDTQLTWLDQAVLPSPLNAWLKINTGMGRLGFNMDVASMVYDKLLNHPFLAKPVRIISHFACSETHDHPLNHQQIEAFRTFITNIKVSSLRKRGSTPEGKYMDSHFREDDRPEYSLCNSAGIFNFPDCHYDYVRPGLAIYGVTPMDDGTGADLGLKPVMTMHTKLVSVRQMKKGDNVGYSARYNCPEDMPIGVAAIGYADGYPITAKETPVLVNGVECKIAGRPAMDLLHIDLRPCPHAKIGDPVVLWGDGLPLERVAEHTSSITWNILTSTQSRVKFVWTDDA